MTVSDACLPTPAPCCAVPVLRGEEGITYSVQWQALSSAALATPAKLRPRALRSARRATWLLSVSGSDSRKMPVRGSPTDPACAAIASLEHLQVALKGTWGNGGNGGRSTLQLTTSGAVAVPGGEPSFVARTGSACKAALAAMLGLNKVIAAEIPSVASIAADTDVQAAGSPLLPIGQLLPGGVDAVGIDAHGVALCGGVWSAPRLLPALPGASGSHATLTDGRGGKPTVAASYLPCRSRG
jgi:hypothetical protein